MVNHKMAKFRVPSKARRHPGWLKTYYPALQRLYPPWSGSDTIHPQVSGPAETGFNDYTEPLQPRLDSQPRSDLPKCGSYDRAAGEVVRGPKRTKMI